MKKTKVLFVCLGNICRSPLAEGIFNHKIQQLGLTEFYEADSCGTGNYHIGSQPDERTIANASANGVSLNHCCRQLTNADLLQFDYILPMDASNLRNVHLLPDGASQRSKISLMREWDPQGKGKDVPDPYFGNEDGFQLVFEILDRTMDGFIGDLESRRTRSV